MKRIAIIGNPHIGTSTYVAEAVNKLASELITLKMVHYEFKRNRPLTQPKSKYHK